MLDQLDTVNPAKNIDVNTDIAGLLTGGGINLINLSFFAAGIFFLFGLLLAAWEYVSSTGDTKKIGAATQRVQNSFFGIVIVLGSFLVVRIIISILGIPNVI